MAYDSDYDVGSEDLGEYVPVIYARSPDEADKYRQLLEDHDIPAMVDEEYEPGPIRASRKAFGGVPVLVPQSLLEDAREFITEIDEITALGSEEDDLYDDEEEQDFALGQGYNQDKPSAEIGDLEDDDLEEDLEDDDGRC